MLQSLMRWPVSSRNGPGLYRERQAGPMSTSGKMQQYHPILGIQVMTPESLSPLPVTGEGVLSPSGIMEPLMKAAWG